MPARSLFATDLDGTLLDREGRVHPADREAIAYAVQRGVVVTIATGRLTTGTLPIARLLELDAPLVCADGGVVVCAESARVLERTPIGERRMEILLEAFDGAELATFVFTHHEIHGCPRGESHHGYVRTWSPAIVVHDDLAGARWREDETGPVMTVAIGARDKVDSVAESLAEVRDIDVLRFDLSNGARVLRVVSGGVSKGTGLAAVARRLGVDRARVAVAGDWLNDLPMFEYAGRSFAMPHAPREVREVATDVVEHDAHARGGIAHALERWLDDLD
ncbi:MAG: HAD-IIB family hydrolase [Polyangiaceae bacterium]